MERGILIGALVLSVLLLFGAIFMGVGDNSTDTNGDNNQTSSGKLRAVECPAEFRGSEICTKEYRPVCGWYNASKIQCIKYPCAIEAGNVCEACSNKDVEYYTEGMCPTDGRLV